MDKYLYQCRYSVAKTTNLVEEMCKNFAVTVAETNAFNLKKIKIILFKKLRKKELIINLKKLKG